MSHAVLTALAACSTNPFVCEGTLLGSIGGGGQVPGSTVRMSTNDLAAADTGETCRQYPMAVSTENTTMTGMLMTAADGVGTKRVALPSASPELFADAALELEYLDSLLLVLSGAARGLFGVNMGAIRADWPEDGKSSAGF
jgi:hypothetical protein